MPTNPVTYYFEFRQAPTGNSVIEAVYHSEGRVAYTAGANPRYEYSIKDHLGNTRLTFCDLNSDGAIQTPSEILQENHYYPFGLALNGPWMNNAAPDNLYQYNGKELQPDHGLGWYDYGFRWSNPELGRFVSVDPLAEKFYELTTYQYASNSPMWMIDLDGLEGVSVNIPYVQQMVTVPEELTQLPGVVGKAFALSTFLVNPSAQNRFIEKLNARNNGTLIRSVEYSETLENIFGSPVVWSSSEEDAGVVAKVPVLEGLSLDDAEKALKEQGFSEPKVSKKPDGSESGYRTYKAPDGSKVTIGPGGRVVSETKPRYADPNNPMSPRVNKGERMYRNPDSGEWEISRNPAENHQNPEYVKT
jgi:RHS repeat-associated protein